MPSICKRRVLAAEPPRRTRVGLPAPERCSSDSSALQAHASSPSGDFPHVSHAGSRHCYLGGLLVRPIHGALRLAIVDLLRDQHRPTGAPPTNGVPRSYLRTPGSTSGRRPEASLKPVMARSTRPARSCTLLLPRPLTNPNDMPCSSPRSAMLISVGPRMCRSSISACTRARGGPRSQSACRPSSSRTAASTRCGPTASAGCPSRQRDRNAGGRIDLDEVARRGRLLAVDGGVTVEMAAVLGDVQIDERRRARLDLAEPIRLLSVSPCSSSLNRGHGPVAVPVEPRGVVPCGGRVQLQLPGGGGGRADSVPSSALP
jgi:hypothetical protein